METADRLDEAKREGAAKEDQRTGNVRSCGDSHIGSTSDRWYNTPEDLVTLPPAEVPHLAVTKGKG